MWPSDISCMWTNHPDPLLTYCSLRKKLKELWSKMQEFSFKAMLFKMLSAKWQPFWSSLSALNQWRLTFNEILRNISQWNGDEYTRISVMPTFKSVWFICYQTFYPFLPMEHIWYKMIFPTCHQWLWSHDYITMATRQAAVINGINKERQKQGRKLIFHIQDTRQQHKEC